MKRVGLNLQKKFVEFLDRLVELEIYPSRNEAIRCAIKDFIAKESNFIQNLNSDMVKLKEIHRKYVEFKEDALIQLGILTDGHRAMRESSISSGKFINKKKNSK